MCGIAGKFYFNTKEKPAEKQLRGMAETLKHRGPDDSGVFCDENIGLSHARLSVIDLSERGHQPMKTADGRFCIVYNGEIYNFRQLRADLQKDGVRFNSDTDTEVILYMYQKYGPKCLQYLRGMFAFVIWDKEKKELFLARDRIGQKPIKFYKDGGTFIFASELKAILKNPEVEKEIDWGAIDEYLTYQYVPHPKTGFKNIYKLEPAHYMVVHRNGEIEKEKYWDLDFSKKENLTEEEWKNRIEEKLKESVRMRLVSDVPLGAHLSGGIDSGLIVAMMAQEMKEPVKTFSIGFRNKERNELPHARLVAEKYNTDHKEFTVEPKAVELLPEIVRHYEEPFADSSALPTWYLSKLTEQHVKVALNGDGGDENFAGYARYRIMDKYYRLKKMNFAVNPFKSQLSTLSGCLYNKTGRQTFRRSGKVFKWYSPKPQEFYRRMFGFFMREEKELIYGKELKQQIQNSRWDSFLSNYFSQASGVGQLNQLLYTDIKTYLPDDLLVKVDISSMAHSLEVRSPFLDHEFMELAASMPEKVKLRPEQSKYILKAIAKDYLPPELLTSPKRGFSVPREEWLRSDLNSYLKKHLLDPVFINYGFNKKGIERLIKMHTEKRYDYSLHLWALLMLRLWLKEYFE